MPFSIGQLLQVASQGGIGFLQGREELDARKAEQARQDAEDARQTVTDQQAANRETRAQEAADRDSTADSLRLYTQQFGTPESNARFGVTGSGRPTISGASQDEASQFAKDNPVTRDPSRPFSVTVDGIRSEFATEEEARAFRDRNEEGTTGGGGFSTADILKDILANQGTTSRLPPGPPRRRDLGPEGQSVQAELMAENELKRELRAQNPNATPEELAAMFKEIERGLR